MSYKIVCNKDQLAIIRSACELYARILMGQFNTILFEPLAHIDLPTENYHAISELLDQAGKRVWGLNGGSPGIRNPKMPEVARTAWDINWVIRHLLAFINEPQGGHSVSFDKPEQSGKCPLPEVSITDDTPDPRPVNERMRDELIQLLEVPPKGFQEALSKIREWKEFYELNHK